MKTVLFAAASTALLALAGTAMAGDELSDEGKAWVAGCEAFQAEHGGNSDCTCLAMKVAEDEEFAADLMSIMGPEDVEALPDESKEKIAKCEMTDEEETM